MLTSEEAHLLDLCYLQGHEALIASHGPIGAHDFLAQPHIAQAWESLQSFERRVARLRACRQRHEIYTALEQNLKDATTSASRFHAAWSLLRATQVPLATPEEARPRVLVGQASVGQVSRLPSNAAGVREPPGPIFRIPAMPRFDTRGATGGVPAGADQPRSSTRAPMQAERSADSNAHAVPPNGVARSRNAPTRPAHPMEGDNSAGDLHPPEALSPSRSATPVNSPAREPRDSGQSADEPQRAAPRTPSAAAARAEAARIETHGPLQTSPPRVQSHPASEAGAPADSDPASTLTALAGTAHARDRP